MLDAIRKFFRGNNTDSGITEVPDTTLYRVSPEKQEVKREYGYIATSEKTQEENMSGDISFFHKDITYILKRQPEKKRGDDSILIDEQTGLIGIADGISGEHGEFTEGPAADASMKTLAMLAEQFKQIRTQANKIPQKTQRQLLMQEQLRVEGNYGVAPTGTFQEQLTNLETQVSERTIQETIAALFTLTRTIDAIDKHIKTKGLSTLSVGKTIPLQDGRHVALYALVGDSYVLIEDKDGHITNMVPPQTWAHYLGQHPNEGPQDPEQRLKLSTQLGNSINMPRTLAIASKQSLARMGMDVSIGVTILEQGQSLIFTSDGIDTIGGTREAGIKSALNNNFAGQADDISVVCCTPKSTEAMQKAA